MKTSSKSSSKPTAKQQQPDEKLASPPQESSEKQTYFSSLTRPTAEFTKALADEIVQGLTNFKFSPFKFRHSAESTGDEKAPDLGANPILIDTSVLIDGRILPIVNSGFLTGTILVPQFVLAEVQHIADSSDAIRRAKGRRGLDIVSKLKWQKVNPLMKTKIIDDDPKDVKEVDHKLVALIKKWQSTQEGKYTRLLTVDFNLAHLARAQGVAVLNVFDIAQALKLTLVPGEEFSLKITHAGKEREQGVGYLDDGTMVVVDNAKDKVGLDMAVVITKIHQTAAGQLFFARPK